MLSGAKESVITLLSTRLGQKLYYNAFCTLWIQYADNIADSKDRALFIKYLRDIEEAVYEAHLEK